MSGNRYKIEIELPPSDGFSTQGDLHLAEIVVRRVREFLDRPDQIAGCRAGVVIVPTQKGAQ